MLARNAIGSAIILLATFLLPATANAQLFRAYLAIDGSDFNPCTLPQPCRLLPAALNAVASGGEIWMLDSANYNTATVNITKSVTILAVPGAVGSVVAVGGPAISIATAGVDVALRNLVIVPLAGGGGTMGVNMSAGGSLTVEGSFLSGLPGECIRVEGAIVVKVADTTIRCGGDGISLLNGPDATVVRSVISAAGGAAVHVAATASDVTTAASVSSSTLEGSEVGGYVFTQYSSATAMLAVRDSQVNRNNFGLWSYTEGGTATIVASGNLVTRSSIAGIASWGGGAKAWATGNTVTGNNVGLFATGGSLFESAGNNAVRNNGTDQSGGVSVVPMK